MKKVTLSETEKIYLDKRGLKYTEVSVVRLAMRMKDENEIAIRKKEEKRENYEYYV